MSNNVKKLKDEFNGKLEKCFSNATMEDMCNFYFDVFKTIGIEKNLYVLLSDSTCTEKLVNVLSNEGVEKTLFDYTSSEDKVLLDEGNRTSLSDEELECLKINSSKDLLKVVNGFNDEMESFSSQYLNIYYKLDQKDFAYRFKGLEECHLEMISSMYPKKYLFNEDRKSILLSVNTIINHYIKGLETDSFSILKECLQNSSEISQVKNKIYRHGYNIFIDNKNYSKINNLFGLHYMSRLTSVHLKVMPSSDSSDNFEIDLKSSHDITNMFSKFSLDLDNENPFARPIPLSKCFIVKDFYRSYSNKYIVNKNFNVNYNKLKFKNEIKITKFITNTFKTLASLSDLNDLSDSYLNLIELYLKPTEYELRVCKDKDEIEKAFCGPFAPYGNFTTSEVYKSSANSCMRYDKDYFANYVSVIAKKAKYDNHPSYIYDNENIKTFYLVDKNNDDLIHCRAVAFINNEGVYNFSPFYGSTRNSIDTFKKLLIENMKDNEYTYTFFNNQNLFNDSIYEIKNIEYYYKDMGHRKGYAFNIPYNDFEQCYYNLSFKSENLDNGERQLKIKNFKSSIKDILNDKVDINHLSSNIKDLENCNSKLKLKFDKFFISNKNLNGLGKLNFSNQNDNYIVSISGKSTYRGNLTHYINNENIGYSYSEKTFVKNKVRYKINYNLIDEIIKQLDTNLNDETLEYINLFDACSDITKDNIEMIISTDSILCDDQGKRLSDMTYSDFLNMTSDKFFDESEFEINRFLLMNENNKIDNIILSNAVYMGSKVESEFGNLQIRSFGDKEYLLLRILDTSERIGSNLPNSRGLFFEKTIFDKFIKDNTDHLNLNQKYKIMSIEKDVLNKYKKRSFKIEKREDKEIEFVDLTNKFEDKFNVKLAGSFESKYLEDENEDRIYINDFCIDKCICFTEHMEDYFEKDFTDAWDLKKYNIEKISDLDNSISKIIKSIEEINKLDFRKEYDDNNLSYSIFEIINYVVSRINQYGDINVSYEKEMHKNSFVIYGDSSLYYRNSLKVNQIYNNISSMLKICSYYTSKDSISNNSNQYVQKLNSLIKIISKEIEYVRTNDLLYNFGNYIDEFEESMSGKIKDYLFKHAEFEEVDVETNAITNNNAYKVLKDNYIEATTISGRGFSYNINGPLVEDPSE